MYIITSFYISFYIREHRSIHVYKETDTIKVTGVQRFIPSDLVEFYTDSQPKMTDVYRRSLSYTKIRIGTFDVRGLASKIWNNSEKKRNAESSVDLTSLCSFFLDFFFNKDCRCRCEAIVFLAIATRNCQ